MIPEQQVMEQTEKKPRSRIEWIDVAKGIGVFIVFYCHATWQNVPPWDHLPVSFVMPMYFILAGLTYNNKKHRADLKRFAVSRGKQFMIPYFILMALWITMAALVPSTSIQPASELVFWFAYGAGPPSGSPHLWFLPMLYLGMMVFVIFDKLLERLPEFSRWFLVLFFVLVTILLNEFVAIILAQVFPYTTGLIPWRLGGVFMTAAFVAIGNEIRRHIKLRDWTIGHLALDIGSIIGFSMILVAVSTINGFTDIASDNIGLIYPVHFSVWLYLTTGIIGTYITFAISSLIVKLTTRFNNFMIRIGNSSQQLYELHPLVLRGAAPFLGIFGIIVTDPVAMASQLWVYNYIFIAVISIPLIFYVVDRIAILRFIFTGSTEE